jgi:squalene-hopene/tetraprenyl-beta-curcumene cyclase
MASALFRGAAGPLALLLLVPSAPAAPKPDDVNAVLDRAVAALKAKQNPDGSFAPKLGGPGITALVAAGLIRNGRGDDPVAQKALAYLEKNVQEDGGIYNKGLANYTTCVSLLAFKEANQGGKYDKVIANAAKFLKTLQNRGDEKDLRFGGVGYDAKSRPDLSNQHFYVEALLSAGVPKDDPAIRDALVFLSRCQNLPGEVQTQEFAKKASDDDKGGFVYNPFEALGKKGGKESPTDMKSTRLTPEGGLRSEGGMTYAGLKSFLYAGVGKDDPRVKAAVAWVRKHYTLDENPGMKDAGLYYYYHTFAKAMDALGEDPFKDAAGKPHDWKQELFEALKKRQADDGSWANTNRAFLENTPELATAYAVLALSYTSKK